MTLTRQQTYTPSATTTSARRLVWWHALPPRLVISGLILAFYIAAALFGPALATHDPLAQDLSQSLQPPSATHLLGTDELGRDILSRLLHGGRTSLVIMLLSVVPSCLLGSAVGISLGYRGGFWDGFIMRLVDAMMSFPGLLLGLLVVSFLGTGTANLILAISIYLLPSFIRISRSAALGVREMDYIESAVAIGGRPIGILWRHVVPNTLTPIVIQLTVLMGAALIIASSLSFLGLGVARPQPEWGLMLADGRQYLRSAPHLAFAPGVTLMILLLALNMLGDALRDYLDPRRPVG